MDSSATEKFYEAGTGYLQTFSGREFNILSPTPEQISIIDIAHALAHSCRYGGQCLRFYSVAEHSVHIFNLVKQENKLAGLMHDASEAYLVDIPRPIKPFLKNYKELEDRVMIAVSSKFKFEYPMPDEVKFFDNAMLTDERSQNMADYIGPGDIWGELPPTPGVILEFWPPEKAELEFLKAFNKVYHG
jgi:hypothetical protein